MSVGRFGFFLTLWSCGFACVHIAWALGWRAGVPDSAASISERPVFLTYDLVAACLMFAASGVAVLLTRDGLSHRARSVLLRATLAGSLLALLRGVPALMWDVWAGAPLGLGFFADVWFVVAGATGLLLWNAVRGAARSEPRLVTRAR